MNVPYPRTRAGRRVIRRIASGLLVITTLLAMTGCARLFGNTGPVPIVVRSGFFGLSWDTERFSLAGEPSAVSHYNVYYRTFGTVDWQFLHATPDNKTTTTIASWELEFGTYEFAIEEVYADDSVSDIHTSMDFTAWPPSGWYIVWEAP